jgi:ketosteroid isomerase-like protein
LRHQNAASTNELIETDLAFSRLSQEKGIKYAFIKYAADSVVILREKSYPQIGKYALLKRFESFSDSGFVLTWEPLFADIARSGELGYTYGIYTSVSSDSTGKLLTGKGTYVSIWKKDQDGQWKYVLDTGNEGLGEQP